MKQSSRYYPIFSICLFGGILLLYLIFPSHNNSGDALSYAGDAKYTQELFNPHHLLYTVTLYLLKLCSGSANTLALGMILNAVFAFLSCLVLFQILRLISINPLRSLLLTTTFAFSFGFWRFATENENYIIPIFFSLLGSFFFVKSYIKANYSCKYVICSGLFATIACLYHQIHIFWFIGLFFGWVWIDGSFNFKKGAVFAATFLIAPVAYFLVIVFYLNQNLSFYNISHFVFHDYYTGAAGNHIGLNNFILGGISLIRTFLQVHGQMIVMLRNSWLWVFPGVLTIFLLAISGLFIIRKTMILRKSEAVAQHNYIERIHIIIFILQLAFAIYNIGNAEFMVMLPVLLAIIIAKAEWLPNKAILFTGLSLLIWNFSYGIYPNNQLHFNADKQITYFLSMHPRDKFILTEPAEVLNRFYYHTGQLPQNLFPSLEYYQSNHAIPELKSRIDSTIESHANVYTDYYGTPQVFSRKSMVAEDGAIFKEYNLKDTVAVFETDAGNHCIFKIGH